MKNKIRNIINGNTSTIPYKKREILLIVSDGKRNGHTKVEQRRTREQ